MNCLSSARHPCSIPSCYAAAPAGMHNLQNMNGNTKEIENFLTKFPQRVRIVPDKSNDGEKTVPVHLQRVGGWCKPMVMALCILAPELFRRTDSSRKRVAALCAKALVEAEGRELHG